MHLILSAMVMSGSGFLSYLTINTKVRMPYTEWDLDGSSILSYKFYISTFQKDNCPEKCTSNTEKIVSYIFSLNVSLHMYLKRKSSTLHKFTSLSIAFAIFISMYTSKYKCKTCHTFPIMKT